MYTGVICDTNFKYPGPLFFEVFYPKKKGKKRVINKRIKYAVEKIQTNRKSQFNHSCLNFSDIYMKKNILFLFHIYITKIQDSHFTHVLLVTLIHI